MLYLYVLYFIFHNLFYNWKGQQTKTNDKYMTLANRLYGQEFGKGWTSIERKSIRTVHVINECYIERLFFPNVIYKFME